MTRNTVNLVSLYLKKEGYEVLTALDEQSLADFARADRPDLIVLDLLLPGIDGRDVCQALRAESKIPIIMLSALDR